MTDYLLSHQLLPEALGRGELVAGLVRPPWILFWWLAEWLLVKPFDLSASAVSLGHFSFPQRGLHVHLCVHSLGAFSPSQSETRPLGQGPFTSICPSSLHGAHERAPGTRSGQWDEQGHH